MNLIIFEGDERAGKTLTMKQMIKNIDSIRIRMVDFHTIIDGYIKNNTFDEDLYVIKILSILKTKYDGFIFLDRSILSAFVYNNLCDEKMLKDFFIFLKQEFPNFKMFIFNCNYKTYKKRENGKRKIRTIDEFFSKKLLYEKWLKKIYEIENIQKNIYMVNGNKNVKNRVKKIMRIIGV